MLVTYLFNACMKPLPNLSNLALFPCNLSMFLQIRNLLDSVTVSNTGVTNYDSPNCPQTAPNLSNLSLVLLDVVCLTVSNTGVTNYDSPRLDSVSLRSFDSQSQVSTDNSF